MLTEQAQKFTTVKTAPWEEFDGVEKPQDIIHAVSAARLGPENIVNSLRSRERPFEKAKFNQEAEVGPPTECH